MPLQEQPSAAWDAHTHMVYGSPGKVPNQICMYGVPSSLEQYADQAQVANYIQYRCKPAQTVLLVSMRVRTASTHMFVDMHSLIWSAGWSGPSAQPQECFP